MTDRVAMLLARVTAGTTTEPSMARSSGPINHINLVMAAMGMGKAGRAGSAILLANYCQDENARGAAESWLARWAWITWLKVGHPDATVTLNQIKEMARLALLMHCNPYLARATSLKRLAKAMKVNHQTFATKYKRHYQRIRAEIAYQESQAISALERHLGKGP